MDIGSDFMVHSPTTIAPDQLPSPLSHPQRSSLSHQLDMSITATENRRRRSSKGGPVNGVKRSASTPNVRGLAGMSESAATLAEKRRNKLGYHRTSVACVHCRRRKIRCLIANDDPNGRCSNCIRLKKECNFFPVDQQPTAEGRPRTGSKQEGKSGDVSASSSSSPIVGTNHSGDHGEQFNQYQHMPLSSHSLSAPLLPLNTSTTMSPPGSAAPITTRFDLQEHPQGSGWNPTFFDGHHIPTGPATTEDHSGGFWKVPEPPITPAFSPYSPAPPTGMMHQNGSFSSGYSAPSRSDSSWQPVRSMSYSHIDEATNHRQDSYSTPYHADMRRSTLDMLPPSLHSSATSSTASMAEVPNGSLAGPATSQSMMHFPGMHQSWGSLTSQSPKSMEFGNWYPEPGQLAKVQEEEVTHFPDHAPQAMYGNPTHN